MRAMVYRSYGGPDKLASTELPRPTPGAGEVLIRVVAASVNPVDWKIASGKLWPVARASLPQVPGFDVAGEVAALGPGVTTFTVGQQVHARLTGAGCGASAEYTRAGVDVTVPMPVGMDAGEAAGLPLAGMTALQGLRDQAGMPMEGARQRILVVGASGGVGHLAVQIARAAGATVVGVCSGRNAPLVASLGAHEVLDYTQPDPYRGQAPFDIVLDCVGGSPGPWMPLLTPDGRFASTLPGPSVFAYAALNAVRGRKVHAVMLKANAADLATLDRLATSGKLRVVVDSRFPLAALGDAWRRSITGRAVGKIIIDVA